MTMQFGMPTLIENKTLTENVELCSRLGLNFIELNMNFPEYQIDKLENADYFINAARNKGLYYTIHLDENLNIADFNPLVAEAYLETVRRTVDVAKSFLCLLEDKELPMVINMHMHHGIHITLPDSKVQMYERDFDSYMQSFETFRSLCEEWIDDSNIRIVIENTDGFRAYEKKAVEFLLESPVFGLTWDIGHSKAAKEIDVPFIFPYILQKIFPALGNCKKFLEIPRLRQDRLLKLFGLRRQPPEQSKLVILQISLADRQNLIR